MVLEATVVCLDTSEWMRCGDYAPTRLRAQADAANLLCGARAQANPENAVGVLAMGGSPRVLATPTSDLGRVLAAVRCPALPRLAPRPPTLLAPPRPPPAFSGVPQPPPSPRRASVLSGRGSVASSLVAVGACARGRSRGRPARDPSRAPSPVQPDPPRQPPPLSAPAPSLRFGARSPLPLPTRWAPSRAWG